MKMNSPWTMKCPVCGWMMPEPAPGDPWKCKCGWEGHVRKLKEAEKADAA